MSLKMDPNQIYLMPIFFGPNSAQRDPKGGRDMSHGHFQPGTCNVFQVTYETDRKVLEAMIPECYTLNDPFVSVNLCEFTNLGWLNGKTYNLININVPVHFKGERDDLDGDLVLTMFENHCDPIVGGRETMGYSKIFCNIPRVALNDGKCFASASNWDFTFMKMTIDTTKPAPDAETLKKSEARSAGKMHYKWIPAVREKEEPVESNFTKPAVAYPTILPKWQRPADYPYEIMKPEIIYCDGKIEFMDADWEDMPTMWQVAKGLHSLVCKRVLGAKVFTYNDPCEYVDTYRLR